MITRLIVAISSLEASVLTKKIKNMIILHGLLGMSLWS